jgi:hypothetical protein
MPVPSPNVRISVSIVTHTNAFFQPSIRYHAGCVVGQAQPSFSVVAIISRRYRRLLERQPIEIRDLVRGAVACIACCQVILRKGASKARKPSISVER